MWAFMAATDHLAAVEYLVYLGYEGSIAGILQLSKGRRQEQTSRSTAKAPSRSFLRVPSHHELCKYYQSASEASAESAESFSASPPLMISLSMPLVKHAIDSWLGRNKSNVRAYQAHWTMEWMSLVDTETTQQP